MLSVEMKNRLEDCSEFLGEWNACLERSAQKSVFMSLEFLRAEWESLEDSDQTTGMIRPFVLRIRDGNGAAGFLPLVVDHSRFFGLPVKRIQIFGPHAMRRGLILDQSREMLEAFLEYLQASGINWNIMEFSPIPIDSELPDAFLEITRKRGMGFAVIESQASPYITIRGSWEDYLNGRSKNFHSAVKNKSNRLRRAGGYRCTEYHSPEEIERILPVLFEIDLRSWKGEAGSAISSSEASKRFYTRLSKYFTEKNGVSIWVLWFRGIPIAFEYHLIYDDVVYSLKWSYDPEYHVFSPGLILKLASTEYFWQKRYKEIDLLGRADAFKMRWTDTVRKHCTLYLVNKDFYSNLINLLEFQLKPLVKRVLHLGRSPASTADNGLLRSERNG